MTLSPHGIRPVSYRRPRHWGWRLVRALAWLVVVALLACGACLLIAQMHVGDARLQAAHAAGMAAGMQFCPER